MLFNESGLMVSTDYWQSDAVESGLPCCYARGAVWHLLLPSDHQVFPSRRAMVIPVTSSEDPVGWRWKLILSPSWAIALPLGCFLPPAPPLPEKGESFHRLLWIYGRWLPGLPRIDFAFGLLQNRHPEIIHRADLLVGRLTEVQRQEFLKRRSL